jgi:hypothetical protein
MKRIFLTIFVCLFFRPDGRGGGNLVIMRPSSEIHRCSLAENKFEDAKALLSEEHLRRSCKG